MVEIHCAWEILSAKKGHANGVIRVLPSVMTVLNFSAVWRLFVAGFGLVLVANSFGARCDLGREIIYKAVATASLSFCFRLEACQPATP